MENSGGPLRLCSGCAGDYEDPDRSAWKEDQPEEEDVAREKELDDIEWWVDEAGEG